MTWFLRYLRNALIAAVLIGAAQWLKGRELSYVIEFAAFWGALSAALFTGTQYYKSWKGQVCAVCDDTPADGK